MKSVADSYDELTAQVKKHRPEAKIFVHQYDHAIPTGKGFLGMGQWLKLPMDTAKVKPSIQQDVVNLLIDSLGKRLETLEGNANGRVIFLRTTGTLKPEQWANELHPTPGGFNKMAKTHWVDAVKTAFV